MRLVGAAKLGFYPTPESVTPIIAKYLNRKGEGCIKVFDPCAGEGIAVKYIGEHLQAETYGIEIDLHRGNRAKEILTKCLVTDYQNTRISHSSFSVLYLILIRRMTGPQKRKRLKNLSGTSEHFCEIQFPIFAREES